MTQTIKKPTITQLIESLENKAVPEDWYRRNELLQIFKGLSNTTLDSYQKEMEEYPVFKEGVIKPTHSVTWINIHIFLAFLRWKEDNRYKVVKTKPSKETIK